MTGMPGCVGAVDGTLIPIKRFADFEGWYCRKGFPAFSVQVVVNDAMEFLSFSIRSGSQNDKSLWNRSDFGLHIHQLIPPGTFFVGDAGYQLFSHLVTPFKITEEMTEMESHFNYHHSRTRMIVERTIGLFKNRFRIYRAPLLQSSPEKWQS